MEKQRTEIKNIGGYFPMTNTEKIQNVTEDDDVYPGCLCIT